MTGDAKIDGWRDMLQLVVGCWLIASPFVLQFFGEPASSATTILLGSFIALVSLLSIAKPQAWEEWGNLAVALALIVSPWVIGFASVEAATWNALASGTILAVLAINTLGARRLRPAVTP